MRLASAVENRPAGTTLRLRQALPVLAALVGYAIFLFTPNVLHDGDTWWQLAAGRWMLLHGFVPHTDPFSYTFRGAPWVAHEWLSEIVTALAYRAGGWDGVLIVYGAAAALTFGMLAVHLGRWTDGLCLVLLLVLGAACTAGSLLVRPHLLALPIVELWTAGLLLARSRHTSPSVFLLPLMVLWANLHGSFMLGLALPLPLALEAVLAAAPGRTRAGALRGWGLFILGAFLAALATPHFWHGLVFPFRLLAMHDLADIAEWSPTNFATLQPIEVALVALLYVALSRGVRLPAIRLLMLLGMLHLALAHERHQMLAGIIGALLLAEPLGRQLGASPMQPAAARAEWGWRIAGLAAVILLTALRIAHPLQRVDDRASPITALDHVPQALARQPVFNNYSFGGYLIFRGIAPFIDGRTDLYGDRFMSAFLRAERPDLSEFQKLVDQYKIRWAILRSKSALAGVLPLLPGWRRLYGDRIATVFVREPGAAHPSQSAGKSKE